MVTGFTLILHAEDAEAQETQSGCLKVRMLAFLFLVAFKEWFLLSNHNFASLRSLRLCVKISQNP